MERDAWNKQHRQKRFQGMGFPVKKPNEYACIVLKSLFCTSSWYLFLSVQLSVQNFPTESYIGPYGRLLPCLQLFHTSWGHSLVALEMLLLYHTNHILLKP